MKIFVTGASGFIGGHLIRKLLDEGNEVNALIRKTSNYPGISHKNLGVFYGDLDDVDVMKDAAKDADYVYHIAGVIHPVNVPEKFYWDANVKGTENVIKACIENKNLKKFIYCSSVTCYGHVDDEKNTIVDEEYPCHSQNLYGKTKYEGEKVVEAYAKDKGLKYIIIRPARVYGPGDMTLLPLFKLIKKRLYVNIGWDKCYMMPVYIDDLVDAFLLCMKTQAVNRAYIIAGSEFMDKRIFIQKIAGALGVWPPKLSVPVLPVQAAAFFCEQVFKILGKEPPLSRKKLRFFLMSRKYSIERAKKELGFNPKVGIEDGMLKTLGWYRQQKVI